MKIIINGKEYSVEVFKTDEEMEKGLQGVEELDDDKGGLFIYDEIQDEVDFWMKNTPIPLDIIFINDDFEVISVKQGVPNSEEMISEKDVKYVLELNYGSGIEEGFILELEEHQKGGKVDSSKMLVLGSDGKPQMEIEGGNRIFSRKNTKTLVKIAKRAYNTKSDKDYKLLGTKIFNFLEIQNNNEPEYVD
jgi:uncharacterized membrane protein (UPF0127 family)